MKLRTRQKVGLVLTAAGAVASLLWPLWGHSYADPLGTQQGELTAGEATAFATGRNAFSMPLPTLDDEGWHRFLDEMADGQPVDREPRRLGVTADG